MKNIETELLRFVKTQEKTPTLDQIIEKGFTEQDTEVLIASGRIRRSRSGRYRYVHVIPDGQPCTREEVLADGNRRALYRLSAPSAHLPKHFHTWGLPGQDQLRVSSALSKAENDCMFGYTAEILSLEGELLFSTKLSSIGLEWVAHS